LDLAIFGIDQGGPIKARHRNRPAKAGRVGEGVGELSAINQQLFRDTAADNASAADPTLLADRDPRTVAAGAARAGDPAGAGANREHVEIIARHRGSLRHRRRRFIDLLVVTTSPRRQASMTQTV